LAELALRKWVIGIGLAAVALAGGYAMMGPRGGEASAVAYRTAAPDRGAITAMVRATGTINPISTVIVGSQLSGQIVEILADYNAQVKSGQIVARLNADQIRSRHDAAQAELTQSRAEHDVKKAQAQRARAGKEKAQAVIQELEAQQQRITSQLADAQRSFERQRELFARGAGARAAFDTARTQLEVQTATLTGIAAQIRASRAELTGIDADIMLADAQVASAAATTLQREAKLRDIQIDLDRTEIRSPVDGVVVQRQVELGQTVAASLSTPTLFLIAQNLDDIEIYANVDEADVGRLKEGQPVSFTVNAYPNRTFEGRVKLVRLGATTVQNVVTYTGVIAVRNMDRALLPGMTANIQVVTDNRDNVLRLPNAALRFRPAGAAPVGLPQAETGPGLGPMPGGGGGGGFGQQAVAALRERIASDVKPTPEQMAAIDAVIADSREAMRAMRTGASPEEMRGLGMTLRREMNQKIAAALDPDRRKLFEASVAARVAQVRAGRSEPEGAPARIYVLDARGDAQAVNIRTGITDGSFTEVVSGSLTPESRVIIGGGPRAASGANAGAPPATPPARGPRLF
jgi:HlyD family secretion protein